VKKFKLFIIVAFLFVSVIAMFNLAKADPRVRYQPLNWTKSGYDYAPSILWDGNQWVMYNCGQESPSVSRDAIFRSTSSDGVNWSTPQVVLRVNEDDPFAWDSGHVCDPSTLKGVNINGYSWAMWYTAISCQYYPDPVCTSNNIGLALSNNGINWIKYSGNPVINCGNVPEDFYGCGQQSVVKVASTYYMSHIAAGVGGFYGNWSRTSTNGITWTAGTGYYFPQSELGAEFMYIGGKWYSVVAQLVDSDTKSILRVYTSSSMAGSKTLIGVLDPSEITETAHFISNPGFYRDALGNQLSNSPDTWIAFGLAPNTSAGDPLEEIEAAKLAILDAEQNSVDPWLRVWSCSGSDIISDLAFAWNSDGPKGDDINYWDITADGDGINEFCDVNLRDFVNKNFSAGSKLEITWYGRAFGGTTANPKVEIWLQNGTNPPVFTLLGYLQGTADTKYATTFTLPASRSNVEAIVFRVKESYFTNLYQSGAYMRTHLFKVRLIN